MKIGQKLILGFVGITLLIGVVGSIALYYQNKTIKYNTLLEIEHTEKKFLDIKERDTKILSSALEVFVQDQAFKDVYLEKDREKLYNYGQPLFQNLKNKYGITHFYFILPDGHCFLRLHNKDVYGDLITRFTFEKAEDTNGVASGIELGKTAFALRVVMPYYHGSELIGYVEFGEEIDHFLRILKGSTNNEFAIFGHKELLNREKWKSVRKTAGLKDNWDDFKEYIVISDTTEGKIEAAREFFIEESLGRIEEREAFFEQTRRKDKTFAGGGFEIRDAGGWQTGAILALIDVTEQVSITQKAELIFLSSVVISLIIALGISIFISHSISAPITKLKNAAVEIGKGKLDTRVEIKSKDEIGFFATSFNKMAKDLSVSMQKEKELAATEAAVESEKKKEEELRAANQQLQSDITERKKAEEERKRILHNMGERVKELRCMYGIANSIQECETLQSIFRDVVMLIPSGWQYPDITRAKVRFDGEEYTSESFKETQWRQTSDIVVSNKRCGSVEVYYIEERPMLEEGPFLKEERHLIDGIAHALCQAAERKKAEQQLNESLEEKEVLLREIHHRVKNNMQVISSLMRLQARSIEDEKSVEIFRECQNRVKSMALIHTKLYQSESLANIDFAEYVEELAQNLMNSYDIEPGKVALTIDVEKISLGVDLAVPCGLLVNELISNSLKHAFPKGAIGEVEIYMHPIENGQIELAVSDNGVGLPEDLDFRKTESLGMQLITSLTEGQLQGKIELNRSAGTEFKVTFNGLPNAENELSKDKHSTESVCSASS